MRRQIEISKGIEVLIEVPPDLMDLRTVGRVPPDWRVRLEGVYVDTPVSTPREPHFIVSFTLNFCSTQPGPGVTSRHLLPSQSLSFLALLVQILTSSAGLYIACPWSR